MAEIDQRRIERAVHEILLAIGEDPSRPGIERTPQRVAEAYAEFFSGQGVDPVALLGDAVPTGSELGLEGSDAGEPAPSDAIILRDIDFRSVCEHHLLPFVGTAHVAYVPGERVVGLGRIPAVVAALSNRPQVQERLTDEIADTLVAGLAPKGVLVVLDAQHRCVTTRGSRQERSSTVTVASRGVLADPVGRAEVIALIGAGHGGAAGSLGSAGAARPGAEDA